MQNTLIRDLPYETPTAKVIGVLQSLPTSGAWNNEFPALSVDTHGHALKLVGMITISLAFRTGTTVIVLAALAARAQSYNPPPEFAGKPGGYKSPLIFDDGSPVKNPADWAKRRAEILANWRKLMGDWPPLLEKSKVEVLKEETREGFVQKRVRVQVAANVAVDGYMLLPEGAGPFPAVLVVFYDAETSVGLAKEERRSNLDFARQLTRRGFVTLSIGSPGGDARRPDTGQPTWQPLSYLAYVSANCHSALCSLPQVDPRRIGVMGHSYGGKWAMFSSCLYEKFAAAVWSDPGIVFDETRPNVNYWEPWYLGLDPILKRKPGVPNAENPRTGAYKVMIETGRDLHELHALMAPRPFLVSGGSEDPPERWLPLNHTIAVNKLLGFTNRVAMTNRPAHSPTAESNEQIVLFFERFLKN
jgi:dienelactone hydrolase